MVFVVESCFVGFLKKFIFWLKIVYKICNKYMFLNMYIYKYMERCKFGKIYNLEREWGFWEMNLRFLEF